MKKIEIPQITFGVFCGTVAVFALAIVVWIAQRMDQLGLAYGASVVAQFTLTLVAVDLPFALVELWKKRNGRVSDRIWAIWIAARFAWVSFVILGSFHIWSIWAYGQYVTQAEYATLSLVVVVCVFLASYLTYTWEE